MMKKWNFIMAKILTKLAILTWGAIAISRELLNMFLFPIMIIITTLIWNLISGVKLFHF